MQEQTMGGRATRFRIGYAIKYHHPLIINYLSVSGATGDVLYSCDFESTTCDLQFIEDPSNGFTWNTHQGSTPSDNTGPSADHTLQNELGKGLRWSATFDCIGAYVHGLRAYKLVACIVMSILIVLRLLSLFLSLGTYIYAEGTTFEVGSVAAFTLPELDTLGTGPFCLTFWYHMMGPHIGALRLVAEEQDSNETLWYRTRDQGVNGWWDLHATTEITRMTVSSLPGNRSTCEVHLHIVLRFLFFQIPGCKRTFPCQLQQRGSDSPQCEVVVPQESLMEMWPSMILR